MSTELFVGSSQKKEMGFRLLSLNPISFCIDFFFSNFSSIFLEINNLPLSSCLYQCKNTNFLANHNAMICNAINLDVVYTNAKIRIKVIYCIYGTFFSSRLILLGVSLFYFLFLLPLPTIVPNHMWRWHIKTSLVSKRTRVLFRM